MTLPKSVGFTFFKTAAMGAFLTATMTISNVVCAEAFYGPVKANDTLSKIIKRFYIGPRSTQLPMMKRLVADNPSAFLRSDMNLLKLNASLVLPGDLWKDLAPFSLNVNNTNEPVKNKSITLEFIDRSASALTVEQMKGRIVFLDTERSSLIEQVLDLKRETQRLEKRVLKLESGSKQSDEQLSILDAEIIRLSSLLNSSEAKVSNNDLNQLVVLQEKLRLVKQETSSLKTVLAETNAKLANNHASSSQANQAIVQLTRENTLLQKLLQDSQPGVHYYNETSSDYKISLFSGKLQLPVGMIVVGSALIALMLIALVTTRRKKKLPAERIEQEGIDPFNDSISYENLLEAGIDHSSGLEQPLNQPEENVFKMFDEGALEMDLKLGMAEAYLQVSDFNSARSILHEVINGGSELQKRKAARLIKKAA